MLTLSLSEGYAKLCVNTTHAKKTRAFTMLHMFIRVTLKISR